MRSLPLHAREKLGPPLPQAGEEALRSSNLHRLHNLFPQAVVEFRLSSLNSPHSQNRSFQITGSCRACRAGPVRIHVKRPPTSFYFHTSTGFPSWRTMPEKPLTASLPAILKIHCRKQHNGGVVLQPDSEPCLRIPPRREPQTFRTLYAHQFANWPEGIVSGGGTTMPEIPRGKWVEEPRSELQPSPSGRSFAPSAPHAGPGFAANAQPAVFSAMRLLFS